MGEASRRVNFKFGSRLSENQSAWSSGVAGLVCFGVVGLVAVVVVFGSVGSDDEESDCVSRRCSCLDCGICFCFCS